MTALLAHHLELQHVPVVFSIMAAGFWIGLEVISWVSKRRK
ncbi:MAG TPA: hypothetical protein VMU54_22450 [Planctomycetota bacterium]|nr:hypothetical protein [Planctomycetota bacterium]